MEKFLVIDGNSILNRAFYGLEGTRMTATDGMPTNAIYGFLNIYYMICEKFNPDYVAVAFDLKAPTFRHEMYEEYKATRKGMPDELRVQMPVMKDILRAMNITIFELEGYEADDVLGTISTMNDKIGKIETYILTGDRDSYQLVSNNTSIIFPSNKAGKTDYTVYTSELLMEEKAIVPKQIIDIKSLMGDASDNIPGVKGIGEKTAYTLIEKYETLDNIYANIETLDASPKIIEKLVNDREMAYTSFELATIKTDVPLDLVYDNTRICDINSEELYKIFKKLGFQKFLSRYDFSNVSVEAEVNEVRIPKKNLGIKETIIVNGNNIYKYIKEIEEVIQEEKLSYILNVIDSDDSFTSILGLEEKYIFAIYSNNKNKSYIMDMENIANNSDFNINDLLENFAKSNSTKLGYNIKQDIRYIFNTICDEVSKFSYDLLIASYLLNPSNNHKFDVIMDELYGVELSVAEKTKKSEQISLFEEEKELLEETDINNINISLKGIYESKEIMEEKLKSNDMLSLFEDVEIPLVETLASMEHYGMYVDIQKLNDFDKEISGRIKELEDSIYEYAGEEFNINSTQQLGVILFDNLKLPTKKKNKTGYSTDKDVLDSLEEAHPIIPLIIEYRQTMKLKTTYVDGLRNTIREDSRIHTTFTQTVTTTGRLSSIEPNLQNIPIRLELGSKIRSFFTAETGRKIVGADYSQIELRVLSHISKDKVMQEAFQNGIDIHKVTASQVFNMPLDEVTKEMRSKAKAVNFGIVYGISEFGLSKNVGVSWKEAKEYMDTYLSKYHGIRQFMEDIVKEAKEEGYVTTLFGRRRYITELKSKNKNTIQFGERVAMNTPIQGTAADIIKVAMNSLYKNLKESNLKSKLIMQVHDELIVDTYEDELDKVKEIMHNAMENVIKLDVPLEIDLNVGNSWYDAK